MLNKLRLFFTLSKEDYLYIKSLGYVSPIKVEKSKTIKTTYTPKGYPSEYCWRDNFTEYVTLLLKDNSKITLIRKFGDDYINTLLSIEEGDTWRLY